MIIVIGNNYLLNKPLSTQPFAILPTCSSINNSSIIFNYILTSTPVKCCPHVDRYLDGQLVRQLNGQLDGQLDGHLELDNVEE